MKWKSCVAQKGSDVAKREPKMPWLITLHDVGSLAVLISDWIRLCSWDSVMVWGNWYLCPNITSPQFCTLCKVLAHVHHLRGFIEDPTRLSLVICKARWWTVELALCLVKVADFFYKCWGAPVSPPHFLGLLLMRCVYTCILQSKHSCWHSRYIFQFQVFI